MENKERYQCAAPSKFCFLKCPDPSGSLARQRADMWNGGRWTDLRLAPHHELELRLLSSDVSESSSFSSHTFTGNRFR